MQFRHYFNIAIPFCPRQMRNTNSSRTLPLSTQAFHLPKLWFYCSKYRTVSADCLERSAEALRLSYIHKLVYIGTRKLFQEMMYYKCTIRCAPRYVKPASLTRRDMQNNTLSPRIYGFSI